MSSGRQDCFEGIEVTMALDCRHVPLGTIPVQVLNAIVEKLGNESGRIRDLCKNISVVSRRRTVSEACCQPNRILYCMNALS